MIKCFSGLPDLFRAVFNDNKSFFWLNLYICAIFIDLVSSENALKHIYCCIGRADGRHIVVRIICSFVF